MTDDFDISDETIRPAEIVGGGSIIRNLRYRDCEFIGPAVFLVAGAGTVLNECRFTDMLKAEDAFAVVDRPFPGLITLRKVTFLRCDFRNIGFVAENQTILDFVRP